MSKYYYKKYEAREVFNTSASSNYYDDTGDYSYYYRDWKAGDSTYYIGTPTGYSSVTDMLKAYITLTEDGFAATQGTKLATELTMQSGGYIIRIVNSLATLRTAYAYQEKLVSGMTLAGTSATIPTRASATAMHNSVTKTAGAYIGEVIAEDGTYPDKGVGTDGYWYVKDRVAIEFKARVSDAWVATEPYVRVNGVWVKADVHPRVNGAWMG